MEIKQQRTTIHSKANPFVNEVGEEIIKLYGKFSRNLIVGISGRGCSGKSTVANKLVEHFQHKNIPVLLLAVDDFVFPSRQRNCNLNAAKARYDDTYDFDTLINTIVQRLRSSAV